MNRTILMLEHDDDDRYITQAIFDENQYPVTLKFVSDSRELTAYLRNCNKERSALPALILLNYHAFPTNGLEILKDLKSSTDFRHIPVVVLSGSIHHDIVKQCYGEGASSFIQKPTLSDETSTKIENSRMCSGFLRKPSTVLGLSIFSSTMPGCRMTPGSMR